MLYFICKMYHLPITNDKAEGKWLRFYLQPYSSYMIIYTVYWSRYVLPTDIIKEYIEDWSIWRGQGIASVLHFTSFNYELEFRTSWITNAMVLCFEEIQQAQRNCVEQAYSLHSPKYLACFDELAPHFWGLNVVRCAEDKGIANVLWIGLVPSLNCILKAAIGMLVAISSIIINSVQDGFCVIIYCNTAVKSSISNRCN